MKYWHYPLILVAGILAQWGWDTYIPLFGLAPQVILVLTVALSSRESPMLSQSFAFVWGFFLDAMGVHLFGGNALALTLVAYCVGLVRRQMDVSSLVPQIVLLGIVSYAYFVFQALLGLVFEGHSFWVGWKAFCFVPFYNCLVAPVGFMAIERFTYSYDA